MLRSCAPAVGSTRCDSWKRKECFQRRIIGCLCLRTNNTERWVRRKFSLFYSRIFTTREFNYFLRHLLRGSHVRIPWLCCDRAATAPKSLGLRSMSGNGPTHVHFQTSVVRTLDVFRSERRTFTYMICLEFRIDDYKLLCFASPITRSTRSSSISSSSYHPTHVNAVMCP